MERAFNVSWESFATAVLVKKIFEASREIRRLRTDHAIFSGVGAP
jgi:hypothetical protein